ncbi:CARDB domain-containing protein [Candidatus Palauibacter sp.]|uniref:CARDB domain-containing protein n=1 Tax=Candidatus Palauibacter sp. TaxID=3101350 RepID=UPI003B025D92
MAAFVVLTKRFARSLLLVLLAAVASCGGDGTTTPAPPPRPPPPPPVAPVQVGTIPNQAIATGQSATLEVSSYFRDPDGGVLTYTAASSAAGVVSVSLSGSTLTMVGVADGTATVTVTARDPDGLTAAQGFSVAVETPNRAPEAVGTIPNQTIQVGETVALDVSPYFTDADGDELTYAAASSNTSVATVSVSGAAVRIQGVGVGRTAPTVTTHDPAGASATQRTNVEVTAPAPDLVFTDASPASVTLTPGESVTFTFRIRNRGTVASGATTIRAMRSVNPTISRRDTELESYSLSSLAPSQDRPFPLTITVDASSAPGTVYIGMCVDAVAEETNARNNCSEGARLTITGSSSARESVDSVAPVLIRSSRPRESTRPAPR